MDELIDARQMAQGSYDQARRPLNSNPCSTSRRLIALGAAAVIAHVIGCASSKAPSVTKPDIDSQAAAEKAIQIYDSNSDGAIDQGELEKSPAARQALANFDANKDGRVSREELEERLGRLLGPTSAFVTVDCTVTRSGQLLADAVVKLTPLEIFGDALPAAEGKTDELGVAHPAIAAEHLPSMLAGAAFTFPGLYQVEITHGKITVPARYNTATELGWEVDPSSRTGTSARFDLKSN